MGIWSDAKVWGKLNSRPDERVRWSPKVSIRLILERYSNQRTKTPSSAGIRRTVVWWEIPVPNRTKWYCSMADATIDHSQWLSNYCRARFCWGFSLLRPTHNCPPTDIWTIHAATVNEPRANVRYFSSQGQKTWSEAKTARSAKPPPGIITAIKHLQEEYSIWFDQRPRRSSFSLETTSALKHQLLFPIFWFNDSPILGQ